MSSHYFAYGSNLSIQRMRERVTSALPIGSGRLLGWRLTLDKRGRDGSGKANIVRFAGEEVWGAIYRIDPDHWGALDRFEGGYQRVSLEVAGADGPLQAQSYTSAVLTSQAVAFDWYHQLMLDGALEHGLPATWIDSLRSLPVREDPRRG